MSQTTPTEPTATLSLEPGQAEVIRLLSAVYRAVDWKAQGGKSVLDRWSGMILVASRAGTVGELLSSLCARLGVGSLHGTIGHELPALLAACQPYQAALLDWVAREHVPVAMLAYQKAREERA